MRPFSITTAGAASTLMARPHPQYPDLHHLLRVIPIAQTCTRGDTAISMLSLVLCRQVGR
jgi:hypothetical protein